MPHFFVVHTLLGLAPGLPIRAALREAVHHAFDPPLRSAALEDLTNTRIPGAGGQHDILAHVARPAGAPDSKPLPVLLLLHEFFGLTESIVGKAQALADELDCVCVAPDTFRGVTTSFIPRAIWLALTTPQARVDADLEDVVSWLAAQPAVRRCSAAGLD